MANVTTELKVVVRSVGKGEIDKLSKALNDLGSKALKPVDQKLKSSVAELKQLSSQSTQTKNNIKGFSSAFKELANNLEIGSQEFKEATAEAKRLDAQIEKLEGRRAGGRLRAGAQIAGTIAGAGVFGGLEGAAGAGIGAILGGAPGAIVGAGIGAQVGQIRQALGGIAEYGAELTKLRIALRGVTESQDEYNKTLSIIKKATEDFAIPQSVLTRQFTRLQASVSGAGGSVADTEKAFKGIVAAVRATGGSLQDVDSALTATAQVFSKGKVSAEELRQQIGERLPGAFTIFAESIGLTPQELDKALEKGQVSLSDFLVFAEKLFDRYYDTSQKIATGPEAAGDRLTVALEELNEKISPELTRLGAQFQSFATEAIKALKGVFDYLGEVGRAVEERLQGGKMIDLQRKALAETKRALLRTDLTPEQLEFLQEDYARLSGIIKRYDFIGPLSPSTKGIVEDEEEEETLDTKGRVRKDISKAEAALRKQIVEARRNENDLLAAQLGFDLARLKLSESDLKDRERSTILLEINQNEHDKVVKILEDRANKQTEIIDGVEIEEKALFAVGKQLAQNLNAQDQFAEKLTETEKLFESIKDTVATGLTDAIMGLIDGTKSLGESLSGILRQMASMFLRAGIGSFKGADGSGGSGLLGLFADGGVIAKNKIVPYASGGVVNKPTLFPMANGMGLMGEAGPEAIMPLRRGRGGRLGVEATSGGVGNVVVNVDASGSAVEGDTSQAAQLGKMLGAAVQAELVKQKRPGGLLA